MALLASCLAASRVHAQGRRFTADAASALARDHMELIETPDMLLHFPASRREEAIRFLARTEGCARYLNARKQIHNGMADGKLRVVFAELPYNNADVSPRGDGQETLALIPTYGTVDFTSESGFPWDPGSVACHELTHYVQAEQIAGLPWLVNAALGQYLTPQAGFDRWFSEGLAVYYETVMLPGSGRLRWPYWRGNFAAGVAGRRLNGGDLNLFNRDYYLSNPYLIGSHFIAFLAEKYGEDKLWSVIAKQGRWILYPFGINVQFWRAYGKSLSTLIDEFADDTTKRYPVRLRPPEQRSLFRAGDSARYARAMDGTQALIDADHDQPARLRILDAEGRVRATRNLAEILPPRKLNIADPVFTSGLSFTGDGRALFFVAIDQGNVYQRARLLRYDVPNGRLTVVASDLGGRGGAISPDGRRYLFARPDGDRDDLAELDVAAGTVRVLCPLAPGSYISDPRFSPNGSRIVATVFEEGRARLALFDGQSGKQQKILPTGKGPAFEASFVDERRLVYLSTPESAAAGAAVGADVSGFQVYLQDIESGPPKAITNVPYLAFQPQAEGGRTLRFLNREGWSWTIDEVELPLAAPLPSPTAPVVGVPSSGSADAASVPTEETASADDSEVAPGTAAPAASSPSPLAATAPPGAPPTGAPRELPVVLSQRSYIGSWGSVPWPKLVSPVFETVFSGSRRLGLQILGADRLQYHIWEGTVSYQLGSQLFSYDLRYINQQLAPFSISVAAADLRTRDKAPSLPGGPAPTSDALTLYERKRLLSAALSRAIYGNPISVGADLVENYRPDNPDAPLPLTRVAGPFISMAYLGVEATPYTGIRRAIVASARAAFYPRALSANDLSFADLSASLSLVLPLPVLLRHTFAVSTRVRTLPGAPADQPLLRIGGVNQKSGRRFPDGPVPDVPDPSQLPPGALLVESLRGFEDYPLAANTFLGAEARYRYPFIIDWGSASSLGVLPAFFLSQIDLDLFVAAAQTRAGDSSSNHEAVGASLSLHLVLLGPFATRFQMSRRLTDDRAWVGVVTIAFGQ